MKLYKLTDENGYTRNNTKWGVGVNFLCQKEKRRKTF